ncbi:transcriptional regulator [Lentzea tibetensis]|uniref:Transcriptional regulator n=1 Tax=Lentzea tibetensis TaxID=2591470 RepID=A0A563F2V6_9PSEU|nr:BTAD domain-containing putative transcriptional regulator [Lentzea tibetensis]TWP54253.1 transcriptional regulator [Lentzea tibetensis]
MRFFVLGHLEVVEDGRPVPLVGFQQRAVLGHLLLNAGRVVSVDQLVDALWGEESPLTARKMLQNAVSGLRRALRGVTLETRPPGYLLRVEPGSLDLAEFHRLTELGRAELADGAWDTAAQVLRDALALWRGPVLGDLGLRWPEIVAAENARLSAFEDCVEAELALGRHHAVVDELESLAAAEPARERLCGQLMLALYRCGRQADALNSYLRTRSALVENYGLDPGRELRELERAILAQDPALMPPAAPSRDFADEPCVERKQVTVLTVIAQPERCGDDDPEHIDSVVRKASEVVWNEVERAGGTVTVTVGPMLVAVFGAPHTREDDAVRGVAAALAIRDAAPDGIAVRGAVTSGEALVRWWPDAPRTPPSVTGAVLDRSLSLASRVPSRRVRVCQETRQATEFAVGYSQDGDALVVRTERERVEGPFVERDCELGVLVGLLEQVRGTRRPHLVTVLGEAGIGKSRLVRRFAGLLEHRPGSVAVHFGLPDDVGAPSVLVVEDVHRAEERVLDRLDGLPERAGAVPLLIVVTARPELVRRRPMWGGGKRDATTMTLGPLSDDATTVLLRSLLGGEIPAGLAPDLLAHVGGNPLFAAEYASVLRAGATSPLRPPRSVHNVIASRLDALPATDKSVLQEAALLGDPVRPDALAALAKRDPAVVAESLERLAREDFLRRTATAGYEFRHVLVRDVARSQLPRSLRHLKWQLPANGPGVERGAAPPTYGRLMELITEVEPLQRNNIWDGPPAEPPRAVRDRSG